MSARARAAESGRQPRRVRGLVPRTFAAKRRTNAERKRSFRSEASPAEIGLAQVFVREQLLRLAFEDEAARREDVAAVCDRQGHIRVLLDHQHCNARLVDL